MKIRGRDLRYLILIPSFLFVLPFIGVVVWDTIGDPSKNQIVVWVALVVIAASWLYAAVALFIKLRTYPFEVMEDGEFIYYGKMGKRAPGYRVDGAARKVIRRLYAQAFGAALILIPAVFYASYRWLGVTLGVALEVALTLGVILVAVFRYQRKKIVKNLPVITCIRPGFSQDMEPFNTIFDARLSGRLFACMLVLGQLGWVEFTKMRMGSAFSWSLIIWGTACWLFFATLLFIGIRKVFIYIRTCIKESKLPPSFIYGNTRARPPETGENTPVSSAEKAQPLSAADAPARGQ